MQNKPPPSDSTIVQLVMLGEFMKTYILETKFSLQESSQWLKEKAKTDTTKRSKTLDFTTKHRVNEPCLIAAFI